MAALLWGAGFVAQESMAATGTGTSLTLANTNGNTYSGDTIVHTGTTLAAGATNSFSANSAVLLNGTVDLGGYSNAIASLSGAGTVTNNGTSSPATLTISGSTTSTFSCALKGTSLPPQ